jgi:peptidoglycan/xylan/chitin deacetylase (PgdA/CDA1 family)
VPGLVLLYHRVATPVSDAHLLCVSPPHFAEHLEVLRRLGRPLPLEALAGEDAPRNAVAVTLDDGYADNLHHARPLLERFGVPATVFVTTGYVGAGREFWWDEVERIFLQTDPLPARLSVRAPEGLFEWSFDDGGGPVRDWHVLLPPSRARQRALLEVCRLLRPLAETPRREFLDRLRAWAGGEQAPRPTHLALSVAELRELARGDLVRVGAHTIHHALLSAHDPEAQGAEIAGSKRHLEEWLDAPIHSFAYPFGAPGDYTPTTRRLVHEAGFEVACSNFPEHPARPDPLQVPRLMVMDWDGAEFERRIRAALGS